MAPHLCADVHIIPMLSDNYGYLIVDRNTNQAACIDPVNPAKVLATVESTGARLTTVLTTHKHWDHSGGNEELNKLTSGQLTYIGSSYEETPCTTKPVKDGDLSVCAYHAPCHTKGHILYFFRNPNDESQSPILFTGDTLFIAGCGRFFEGDASQMVGNMTTIGKLPDDTHLYPGHEYTVKNLEFAISLEPNNENVKSKLAWATERRGHNEPTVPAILSSEKTYNPFMRFNDPQFMKVLGTKTAEETMAECRAKKDAF